MKELPHRIFGTAALDAPVPREDFERALRALHTHDMLIRDQLHQLAAHVVALTNELTRRMDGVEPTPEPPPPEVTEMTIEQAVEMTSPSVLKKVRANDQYSEGTVTFDDGGDKYAATPSDVPCAELIPLCQARCCKMRFSLSTQDLDEGIIRFDYGQPYLIRQRASDRYCVHNDPDTKFCTVREARPRVCRSYDCRNDKRIWIDYEKRIPATEPFDESPLPGFDLFARALQRTTPLMTERIAIAETYPDREPKRGPKL